MGIDIGAIFDSAKQAVEQSANDAYKTITTSGLGYLEDQAIKVLQADKAQNEKAFQTHAATILQRPSALDSFGAYVSNLTQSPVLKEYGPYVIGAVVLCFGVLVLVGRK